MTTVRNIVVILAGMVILFVIVMLATSTRDASSDSGVVTAQEHVADVLAKIGAEHERRSREAEIEYVTNAFGEDAGNLFYRCTTEPPPANPSNQSRCQNLLRRVHQARDADAAADARDKANW